MTNNKITFTFPWRGGIQTRLIIFSLIFSLVPLFIVGALSFLQARDALRQQTSASVLQISQAVGDNVQRFLLERQGDLLVVSRNVLLTSPTTPQEEKIKFLRSLQEAYGVYVSFYVVDTKGQITAATDETSGDQSQQSWFKNTIGQNKVLVSDVYYLTSAQRIVITISAPIFDTFSNVIGVVAGNVESASFSEVVALTKIGEQGEVFFVNREGRIVVDPFIDAVFTDVNSLQAVQAGLRGETGSLVEENDEGVPTLLTYIPLPGVQDWIAIGELPLAEVEGLANALATRSALVAAIAAGVIGFLVFLVARRIVQPIRQLITSAERLSSGDFKTEIPIQSSDEIGQLAGTFRSMAGQLNDLVGSLEERVAARTRDLATTLEVGQLATSIYREQNLLPRLVDFIRDQFNLYYTQIYLLDEAGRYAVLRAGTGEVGQQLLARNHRLNMAETSLVATAVQTRQPVLVSDTENSPIHKKNPLLPSTRSEVSIPLMVGNEILGVLDMQAEQVNAFNQDNVAVFQAMATQIASVLRGARAYEEAQEAALRVETVNQRLTREGWQGYLGSLVGDNMVGFEYDLEAPHPIEKTIQVQKGDEQTTIVQPVVLRGAQVGNIVIKEEDIGRPLGDEERTLVEDVARRVAQSLEQYRAFDETQQRAQSLSLLNQMSAEFATATSEKQIFDIVANRSGQILKADRASIALFKPESDTFEVFALQGEKGAIPLGMELPVEGTALGFVLRQNTIMVMQDTRLSLWVDQKALAEQGMHAIMNAPLLVSNVVIGTLNIARKAAHSLTSNDESTLLQISNLLSITLQNRRLFAQVEQTLAQTEMLYAGSKQISRAAQIEDILSAVIFSTPLQNVDSVSIMFFNRAWRAEMPESAVIEALWEKGRPPFRSVSRTTIPLNTYPMIGFFRRDEAFVVNDVEIDTRVDEISRMILKQLGGRSLVSFPMVIGQDWIGMLSGQSTMPLSLDPDQIRQISSLVDQAVGVIQTTRLYQQTQEALQETERLFTFQQAILDSANTVIISTTTEGIITSFNAAAQRLLGYAPEEVINKVTPAIIHDGDEVVAYAKVLSEELGRVIEPGFEVFVAKSRLGMADEKEWTYIRKDGTRLPVLLSVTGIRDQQGNLTGFLGIATDITERKAQEERIRSNQVFLDSVIENIPNMVFVKDASDLRFISFNEAGEELLGFKRADLIGKNDYDFFPKEEADFFISKDREVLAGREIVDIVEEPIKTAHQGLRYLHTLKVPILDRQGNPQYLLGISEDITERKQQQESIRQAREDAEILYQLSAAVNQAKTEQDLVNILVNSAIYPDPFHIQLLNGTYNEHGEITGVKIVADWRQDSLSFVGGFRKIGDVPFFQTVDRSDVFIVDDVEQDPRLDEATRNILLSLGNRTFVAVPLVSANELIGGITLASNHPQTHDENQKRLLRSIAEQITAALARIRLAQQTERRASELTTVAQVSAATTHILELDELLQTVVDLTKERFGLYHTHIYLLDEQNVNLVLAAGVGEAGQFMKNRGHSIPLGREQSLVARAARTHQPVISNDVTSEPNFLPNPLLPDTRSELAIPMIIGDKVVGVLDVQASTINRFGEDDANILRALGDQIAVAVENARAYQLQLATTERLREVDKLKSQFLANMSHELRTPLNSIIGYAEVLLDGIDGELNDEATEDVQAIYQGGRHLLTIINDVLDLAKIEAGQMVMNRQETNLMSVIDEVIETCEILARNKNIDLNVEENDALPAIYGDPIRVKQIILNLVNNAIKFTQHGGVTIKVGKHNGSEVAIWVKDTGIGMTAQEMQSLFQQFHQVDGSATRRAGGTGLGLVISRHLVHMHQGEIYVESEKGVGSTFWFTIPEYANGVPGKAN